MITDKQYEVLDGLPPYGPMYISVSANKEELFFSEGYVLRIFKSDGTSWVANFRPGWTNYNNAFDFPDKKTIVVVAGGQGYIMSPDNEQPILTFGLTIKEVIQTSNGSLIFSDDIYIILLDNRSGQLWASERISWDGIKDLEISGQILCGKAYDPTNSNQQWSEFSINLETKEITGGTYRDFLKMNSELEVGENGMLQTKEGKRKPWWEFW